jgi:hypothetical protein
MQPYLSVSSAGSFLPSAYPEGEPMRKYVLIFAMLAIVLTACRIESNVNLDIEEDGSAVVLMEVGFDDEFRQLLTGQTGGSEEDFVNEILSVGDTSLVQRTEGDMTYYGAAQEIEDLSQGLPVDAAEEMFTSFEYSFDEDGASLSARIESVDAGEFGDVGDLGGIAEGLTGDIFSASLIVRMPGTVTSHNATEVRGDGALVWNIPFSGSLDVQAESTFGTTTTNWFWFGLLIAVIVVAAVSAGIAVIVTRKSSEKAVAAAIAAHEAANAEDIEPTDNGPDGDDADEGEDRPQAEDTGSSDDDADEGEDRPQAEDTGSSDDEAVDADAVDDNSRDEDE